MVAAPRVPSSLSGAGLGGLFPTPDLDVGQGQGLDAVGIATVQRQQLATLQVVEQGLLLVVRGGAGFMLGQGGGKATAGARGLLHAFGVLVVAFCVAAQPVSSATMTSAPSKRRRDVDVGMVPLLRAVAAKADQCISPPVKSPGENHKRIPSSKRALREPFGRISYRASHGAQAAARGAMPSAQLAPALDAPSRAAPPLPPGQPRW